MTEKIAELVPSKTDVDAARAFRDELMPILEQACAVLGRARAAGLVMNFNIGLDQYGRTRVAEISVVKPIGL